MGALGRPFESAVSGEEDHSPVAVLRHVRDGCVGHVKRPVQHHTPDALPFFQGETGEGLVGADSGVADQDVHSPELLRGGSEHIRHLLVV